MQNLRVILTSCFGNKALVVLRVDQLLIQSDISNNKETSETKQGFW